MTIQTVSVPVWRNERGAISRFAPEWLLVAALALVMVPWARAIGLTFTIEPAALLMPLAATALMLGLWVAGLRKGQLIAEYFILTLTATIVFCAFSYLCLASAHGSADTTLAAMDRALGFDWLANYRFIQAHGWMKTVLGAAYQSLIYQGIYFCALMGIMGRVDRLRELFWLFTLCGLTACLVAMAWPALGPFKTYNLDSHGFIPVMEQLLARHDLHFVATGLTGVVGFPSFHTSMALAYCWSFRGTGAVGRGVTLLNLVMLVSVPAFGGHYLVDMIGGAAVLLAAVTIIETVKRISAASAWPGSAAAYAGAYSTGAPSR